MHSSLTTDPIISQLQAVLRDTNSQRIIPVGMRSKSGLIPRSSGLVDSVIQLEIREYQGIVAYDPTEFLISARAGTAISDVQAALSENGQYLPFDPLFAREGATIGGTIASGVSGPDRLLYGGVRDFIMEVAMLDGLGNLVRGGGKVVKNAAGFDTPKMMVGSYGRLGIIVEATLKVFPSPQSSRTLAFDNATAEEALALTQRILSKPFPITGIDQTPENKLIVRLAGPSDSLNSAIARLEALAERSSQIMSSQQHLEWRKSFEDWIQAAGKDESLVRVALPAKEAPTLCRLLLEACYSNFLLCAAGCTAWIKLPLAEIRNLSQLLRQQSLSGIVIRGDTDDSAIGDLSWQQMAARIQRAIDPNRKFLAWGP